MLMLGLAALTLHNTVESDQFEWRLLLIIPAILLIASRLFAVLRDDIACVVIDHRVVFSLFFCLYFLIGASVASFEQDDPEKFNVTGLPINEEFLLLTDAINLIGFGVALGVSTIFRPVYLEGKIGHLAETLNQRLVISSRSLCGLLICIGFVAKVYLFLNAVTQNLAPISGVYHYLALALPFGIFVFVLFEKQLHFKIICSLVFLVAVSSLIGVVLFSKFDVMTPVGALFAAYSVRKKSILMLALTILGCIGLLGELAGAIQYSRDRLFDLGGADVLTRFDIFIDGMIAARSAAESSHGYNTTDYFLWGRFSFTEPQIFAVQQYEQGEPSLDWLLWPWVFVPRFLDEAKPIMSLAGQILFSKMLPRTGSSVSIGIFVDGYYNGGWLGVIVFSSVAGWILSCTSAIAKVVQDKQSVVLYPLLAVGLYIGFKVDGFWITDYLAPFITLAYALTCLMGVWWLFGFISSIGHTKS